MPLTSKQARRLTQLVAGLNELRAEVSVEYPEAQWYLDGTGNLCLLSDGAYSSNSSNSRSHQERILASEKLSCSSGGDW